MIAKLFSLLFCTILVTSKAVAQSACADSLMRVEGTWQKRPDANMKSSIPASAMQEVNGTTGKILQQLRLAYPKLRGMDAFSYQSMSADLPMKTSVHAYELNVLFPAYYCNTNLHKMMRGTETASWFFAWVNQFHGFARKNDNFIVRSAPVYLLTPKTGSLNGLTTYAGNDNRQSATGTSFSTAVLISRKNQSPFIPVSRKEYLMAFLSTKEKTQQMITGAVTRTALPTEVQETANKKYSLDQVLKQTRANPADIEKAKTRFLENYKTPVQKRTEELDNYERVYQLQIRAAKDLLNTSTEADLLLPAYFTNYQYENDFNAFASADKGLQMVILNDAYFNPKLPESTPQFIILYWQWEKTDASEKFNDQIVNHFDFSAISQIIDK